MNSEAKILTELLKVLANEHRLMILCVLMEEPKTVGGISEKIPDITQSALSQHLSVMKARGLLDCTKKGQSVTYRIADSRVEKVIKVLKEQYCEAGL